VTKFLCAGIDSGIDFAKFVYSNQITILRNSLFWYYSMVFISRHN